MTPKPNPVNFHEAATPTQDLGKLLSYEPAFDANRMYSLFYVDWYQKIEKW